MSSPDRAGLTRMLDRASAGDRQAAAELLPVVYRQLRAQAQQQLMNERPGHTLQATALVHEAFMKLVGPEPTSFAGRAHFYAAAAEAMRRILIDHARARGAVKRGRDWTRDAGRLEDLVGPDDGGGLLELDDAIEALRRHEPRAADVVTLRFYGGLSIDQIALLRGVSARTVDRVWRFARAWLLRELAPTNDDDGKGTTHDG